MAEEVGFEPTVRGYPTTVFKTAALSRSATPPYHTIFEDLELIDRAYASVKKIKISELNQMRSSTHIRP